MILPGPLRRHRRPLRPASGRIPAMESYIVFGLVLLVVIIGATLALVAPRFRKPPTLPPAPPEAPPKPEQAPTKQAPPKAVPTKPAPTKPAPTKPAPTKPAPTKPAPPKPPTKPAPPP